jgi:hypothetical protein
MTLSLAFKRNPCKNKQAPLQKAFLVDRNKATNGFPPVRPSASLRYRDHRRPTGHR